MVSGKERKKTMTLFAWIDKKILLFRWFDISLIKLSVLAFTLMVAKLWAPILGLDWYWYGVVAIIVAIPVWVRMAADDDPDKML